MNHGPNAETDAPPMSLNLVVQKALERRLSYASLHWGTEDVNREAWPHLADAVAQSVQSQGWVYLPCDAGCHEYPEEDCSRHGRKPNELWRFLAEQTEAVNHWRARAEAAEARDSSPGGASNV